MTHAYISTNIRTPIGRAGGALSSIRGDDLAALPLKWLLENSPGLDPTLIDEVIMGNATQAGEDNRNVARMALLLAGLPDSVPGVTVNRLCGSGLEAVGQAARAIRCEEASLMIAGGAESMSRAPYVMLKPETAFARAPQMEDTTVGWRFVNPKMKAAYGVDSMPETAENVAEDFNIARADQDAFAYRSQQRTKAAEDAGRLAEERMSVTITTRKSSHEVSRDEHPRAETSLEKLASLRAPFREGGSVTAGNASGVNDGAAAILVGNEKALAHAGAEPRARVVGMASAGVAPRIMGFGPAPAVKKLLARHNLKISDIDVLELNEAFASQALAVTRDLGLPDDAEHVNPNGGAIALGHPLGMSGARLVMAAERELHRRQGRYAIATMCIGVGQGLAMLIERV